MLLPNAFALLTFFPFLEKFLPTILYCHADLEQLSNLSVKKIKYKFLILRRDPVQPVSTDALKISS